MTATRPDYYKCTANVSPTPLCMCQVAPPSPPCMRSSTHALVLHLPCLLRVPPLPCINTERGSSMRFRHRLQPAADGWRSPAEDHRRTLVQRALGEAGHACVCAMQERLEGGPRCGGALSPRRPSLRRGAALKDTLRAHAWEELLRQVRAAGVNRAVAHVFSMARILMIYSWPQIRFYYFMSRLWKAFGW